MDLNEYAEKRDSYFEFAKIVKTILEKAIRNASKIGPYKYNLQHIQYRAKSVVSLISRLQENSMENADNIEDIRDDLAGCRIIFYYNNDVNEFTNSGLIFDLFKIDRDKIKIHGPIGPVKSANDEYTAVHYTVELNPEMLAESEYKKFTGMKCEVQVQTILCHAFSETIHDILYKKPTQKQFGTELIISTDKLMQKIMSDYLKPAGHQLQNVKNDYQRLLDGKILFDRNLKDKIVSAKNNNERYELLNKFCENTLPLCDDGYFEQEVDSIIDIAADAVKCSQYVDPVPIRISFLWGSNGGTIDLNGKTFKDVLRAALEILSFIRYINPKKIFNCMIECYLLVNSDDEKELIQEYILKLVNYRVEVLKKTGIIVQEIVLNQIESATSEVIQVIKPVVISICEAILDPVAEGTTSSYKTITLIQGCLPGNKAVSSLRDRALKLLMRLYNVNSDKDENKKIFTALYQATRLPSRGKYSDELMEVVLRNCIDLITFYSGLISCEKYEQLSEIEDKVFSLYNRTQGILIGKREFSEGSKAASKEIANLALNFKKILNANAEYVVYKTLVGYRSVFDQEWHDVNWNANKIKYRENKASEYVSQIQNNKEYWRGIILKCAATQSNEGATFIIFEIFLKLLGRSNPDFVFDLLNNNEDELSNFIPVILNGLLNSKLRDSALEKIKNWIIEGKRLYSSALSYQFDQPFDQKNLELILEKAIEMKDNNTLRAIISVIPKNFTAGNESIVQSIFIPALKAMIDLNDAGWIDAFYYQINCKKIILSLDEQAIDTVLKCMLHRHNIDYKSEAILNPIAEKYPDKIYDYFSNRISLYERDKEMLKKYEPIPDDDFEDLLKPLSSNPKMVTYQMKRWYDADSGMFPYHGAKLIHKIFPDFSPNFEAELIELIHSGDENDLQMVIIILRSYKGTPAIIDTCKEIIKKLPYGNEKLEDIENVLNETGVLSGDYGSVDACNDKMQQISPWLQDQDKKVIAFAERYTKKLQMRAKDAQRRAEERIEQMKHQYGDDETNNV